jgi:hypothetical protein
MLEYRTGLAIAAARDRERSGRILGLLDVKLRELAQETADLLRDTKDDAQEFASLWDAICCWIAKGKSEELQKFEERVHAMCRQTLQENCDAFSSELLATITTECDEFYRKATRREKPPLWSLENWAAKAIYPRLLELARVEARSSFLSYDPELLDQVIVCLRSLIPMADNGSGVTAIGRAIDAVESFESGKRTELNLDIGCGFRAGDAGFEEGKFAFIEIREEGIRLSTLHTTYEKQVGSDHSSEDFSFPGEFERWHEIFETIRNDEQAKLSVNFLE